MVSMDTEEGAMETRHIVIIATLVIAVAAVFLGLRPPLVMQAWATAVAWERRRRAFVMAAEYLQAAVISRGIA